MGGAFLKLADGMGWVPENSRKDANRKVVEEAGSAPALALAGDEKGQESDDDPTSAPKAAKKGNMKGESLSKKKIPARVVKTKKDLPKSRSSSSSSKSSSSSSSSSSS